MRSRRRGLWLLTMAAIAVAAAIFWSWRETDPGAAADRNVLLITIDTLRADALGSYGGRASTPNLDRLAARGTRFTFAHAHSVMTLPSHASILTGRLPFDHGVRDNSGYRLADGTPTLATRLKAAGFATAAFVTAFPLASRFGLGPGFDVYDDEIPDARAAAVGAVPERRGDVVVARAREWIARQQGRFFTWVHVFDPHAPYRPPDQYLARDPDHPYAAEVSWTDALLGPLIDSVDTLSRPTLVIVTSDHGESLGEHGELTHGMFAYESTLRVPLIVSTIGAGSSGSVTVAVNDAPVRLIDIAPTVIESAGLPPDPGLPGASLRAIDSRDRPSYFEALTYNLVRGWAPLTGVIGERMKYIRLPIPELYDLATDPGEATNLAPSAGPRVATLAEILTALNSAAPAKPGRESQETTAKLRSLGYISGAAPAKARYGEADDPKRLVSIDRDLQRTNDLIERGMTDDAIALLRQVIARRNDTADAYVTLAHVLWEGGRSREAVATLQQAVSAGAPGHELRLRLGIYLAESGIDPDGAERLLETLPRDDVDALNALGIARLAAGRPDPAIRAFRDVLAIDPSNGLAYQNLAAVKLREALATGSADDRRRLLQEADDLAQEAVRVSPALARARTTLGVIQAETGRKAEAIESWKEAVALDGSEFDALYNLTVTLHDAGQLDEARGYAAQFVRTAPAGAYGPAIRQLRALLGR